MSKVFVLFEHVAPTLAGHQHLSDLIHRALRDHPYKLQATFSIEGARAYCEAAAFKDEVIEPEPEPPKPEEVKEGWVWLPNTKKVHYYVDGRSLCGKWAYLGRDYEAWSDSQDHCAECKKRKARR